MNIIEDLYFGNIHPYTKYFDPKSEYAKLMEIIADNEEKLIEYLNTLPKAKDEQHLFSQLMNAQNKISTADQRDRFVEGFQLGARFMLDMLVVPQNSLLKDI